MTRLRTGLKLVVALALFLSSTGCALRSAPHVRPFVDPNVDRSFSPHMRLLDDKDVSVDFQSVRLATVMAFWKSEFGFNVMYPETLSRDRLVDWQATGAAQDAFATFMEANDLTYKRANDRTVFLMPDTPGMRAEFVHFPRPVGPLYGHPGYRRRFQFDLQDVTLEEALQSILSREHLRYTLGPGIDAHSEEDLRTTDVTVGEALMVLCYAHGLTYELDRNRVVHFRFWKDVKR